LETVSAGVPADEEVLVIGLSDDKFYRFQFLYAGTPGSDPDSVEVPLPNSGLSTAAEVMTALLAVLLLSSAFNQAGDEVYFPWVAQSVNPTTSRINLTTAASVTGSFGVTNVTITAISQPTLGFTGLGTSHGIPGSLGKLGAFLPGP
jgi:hypothetical protein